MAKQLSKQDIVTRKVVKPGHVSQSIDAFTGIEAYDITISGSLTLTGSLAINGLSSTAQTNVLTINSTTGQVGYTASSAIGGGGSQPLKYVALITQTGTNPPISTVLENTLGAVTFSYLGTGTYEIIQSGSFLANKTWVIGGSADINAGGGDLATLDIRRFDDNSIALRTYDNFSGADNLLVSTSIEIRVYP